MKISDRIRNAMKSLSNPPLGNSLGYVARNYNNGSHFEPQSQLKGITYKGVDKIGQAVSIYEPIVQRSNGETIVNHPLIQLFNKPNPNQNGTDFLYLFAMLYTIYGETFWYKVRGESTGKIKELYLLNPAQIELKMYSDGLAGYVLHKSNGDQVPFMPDEILHDKRPNPFNEWRGMSVMERAAVYIDTEITTATFTLNYMRNNASPSGIVTLPNMEKEAFKQFTAQWREGYEGPENAGKTAFIRGGEADFKAVGATLKDVDQKITREMAKNDVLMMLEVPKEILGLTDSGALGRSTIEAFSYVFSKETIEPIMRRLDRIYESLLSELKTNDNASNVTHESPVAEDKEFELKRLQAGVNVWMTINEARAEEGLEPLPDGDILMPKNTAQQQTEQTKSVKKKIVLKKAPTKAELAKKLNREQEKFRSDLVKTNDIYAVKLKSEISKFAKKQGDKVIANINATGKAYEEWLPSAKEESEKLAKEITPIIIELMEAQSEDVANFITGELLTVSPEMKSKVYNRELRLAGQYNEDTLRALQKTLSEGQTNSESLVKLKKRVEQVYSDAAGYRAERIARTESLRASNDTAEQVYFQNGFTTVEWFTNPGACEFCATYSGQTKTIGSNFINIGDVITGQDGSTMRIEYSDIETPPLHPNCTCSLVPVE